MASPTNRVLGIFMHANWNKFEQTAIKHSPRTAFHYYDRSQLFLNIYLVLERMNFRDIDFNNRKRHLRKVNFLHASDIKSSIYLPGIQAWCYNELCQGHGTWQTHRFHSSRLCEHYGDTRWKRTWTGQVHNRRVITEICSCMISSEQWEEQLDGKLYIFRH